MIHPFNIKNRITTVSLFTLLMLTLWFSVTGISAHPSLTEQNPALHQSFLLTQVESDPDRVLSEQIRTALKEDTTLAEASKDMSISTTDGLVAVRGTAKSDQDKYKVFALIRKIPGVFNINDQVQVKVTK